MCEDRTAERGWIRPVSGALPDVDLRVGNGLIPTDFRQVDAMPAFEVDEVTAYLRENTVQLIGISVSCERFLEGAFIF